MKVTKVSVKTPSRLSEAMLETAEDMHRLGIMDEATYEKIRLRHLGENSARTAGPAAVGRLPRSVGK